MPVDDQTILNHKPLVLKVATFYSSLCATDLDDLIQQGWLGLIKAGQKWDDTKNVTFGAYASLWVKGSIYRYVFGRRPMWEESFDSLIGEDHHSERRHASDDLLLDALDLLPADHASVMRERLLNRATITGAARATGHTTGDTLALYEQGIAMLKIFTE
jgi:RNA polymerase sigma factor (sigma-70 family)